MFQNIWQIVRNDFVYGFEYCNAVVALRFYQERYPGQGRPDRNTFVSIYRRHCDVGNFVNGGGETKIWDYEY
jgi:hypothetical protein